MTAVMILSVGAVALWALWRQSREIDRLDGLRCEAGAEAWRYQLALLTIAGMATPRANATVKRMAKVARDATEVKE